jgi:hypothetical protein
MRRTKDLVLQDQVTECNPILVQVPLAARHALPVAEEVVGVEAMTSAGSKESFKIKLGS